MNALFPTYIVDYSRISGGVKDLCGETRQPSGKVRLLYGAVGLGSLRLDNVFKCVKNASWPFLQGEGACKRFLAIFCTWMSILENSNLHSYEASLQTFMCCGPRVSWANVPTVQCRQLRQRSSSYFIGSLFVLTVTVAPVQCTVVQQRAKYIYRLT